ncbi:MAG: MFS transporter, partial [Spirochaetaceae bacterium]
MNDQGRQTVTLKSTFIALTYPNYRFWYVGQMISLVGTWMQSSAQGFYAFEITKSKAFLGTVSLAQGIPSILFMLVAGVLAERFSRRMLIIVTQVWLMLLAMILAVLVFLKIAEPWHILVISFFTGTANAMSTPARHAIVADLVEAKALNNAISLNSSMFNLGTSIGPMVGGFVYKAAGPAWCFLFNSVSFLAMIAGMAMMKLAPRQKQVPGPKKHPLHELKDGLAYVAGHSRILTIIIITGVFSFFGFSLVSLFPAWAKDV